MPGTPPRMGWRRHNCSVVVGIIGAPAEIIEPARLGLMIMPLWTWVIAYRRFNQGVLIRFGHSRAVSVGTMIRLSTNGLVLATGYLIGAIPGIVVATSALTTGVVSEAIYAGLRVRPVLRDQLRQAPPVERSHQFPWLAQRRLKAGEETHGAGELFYHPGVCGGQLLHVLLQLVNVGVDDEGLPTSSFDALKFLVVDHASPLHRAQFLPDAVETAAGPGADQPVNAPIEGVSLTFPGGAQAARLVVQLKDLGAVAVHLAVAPGGQAGNARPDDDD